MKNNQEQFEVLRKVSKKPNYSQRQLASELNISVGKINYILMNSKKGLVKISNFKKNKNKSNYFIFSHQKELQINPDLQLNL